MQNNYTNDLLELKGENIKITNVYKEGKIRHIYLELEKAEHICPHCNKRFPETNNFVNKYSKISFHTKKLIIHEYRKNKSIKEIELRLNISFNTIMRHINLYFKPRRLKLPEIISIDEFKNLKNAFGKYAFIMVVLSIIEEKII